MVILLSEQWRQTHHVYARDTVPDFMHNRPTLDDLQDFFWPTAAVDIQELLHKSFAALLVASFYT